MELWDAYKADETRFFNVVYEEKDSNVIGQIRSVIDSTYENILRVFSLEEKGEIIDDGGEWCD